MNENWEKVSRSDCRKATDTQGYYNKKQHQQKQICGKSKEKYDRIGSTFPLIARETTRDKNRFNRYTLILDTQTDKIKEARKLKSQQRGN